jgi:D-alanine-D-alanine ligase
MFVIDDDRLPPDLDRGSQVVFSTLHGTFGEDGGMQGLLDAAGVSYAGCDAASSALTMDKTRTKETVAARGVRVPDAVAFDAADRPSAADLLKRLGDQIVLKPNGEGSSVGLSIVQGGSAVEAALRSLRPGRWMAERRVRGRELTVGILGGRAMGVVEIRPHSGVFDYVSKYTKGLTEYLAPAPIDPGTSAIVQAAAETAFAACACRDYARADFILSDDNEPFLLEINTLPGMKETSLLPMSARCVGKDFAALVREMVTPAFRRFHAAAGIVQS